MTIGNNTLRPLKAMKPIALKEQNEINSAIHNYPGFLKPFPQIGKGKQIKEKNEQNIQKMAKARIQAEVLNQSNFLPYELAQKIAYYTHPGIDNIPRLLNITR